LRSLKKLDLTNNFIAGLLPESIGDLGQLEELYLRQNHLNELPASFVNLKVSFIYFSAFFISLTTLQNLRRLDLRSNRMTQAALVLIGRVTSLEFLDLTSATNLSGTNGAALEHLINLKDIRIGNCGIDAWVSTSGHQIFSFADFHLF